MALAEGKPGAAQLVAAEAVVLAETKDHQNWHLIGEVAKKVKGDVAKVLKEAHDEVEHEEDEHLYHTKGWCARALDRIARHEGRAAATGRGEEGGDGDRRRACGKSSHSRWLEIVLSAGQTSEST